MKEGTGLCGQWHLWVSGPGLFRKVAGQAKVSKPVSSTFYGLCFSSWLQVPSLSSCSGFPWWCTCKLNNPFGHGIYHTSRNLLRENVYRLLSAEVLIWEVFPCGETQHLPSKSDLIPGWQLHTTGKYLYLGRIFSLLKSVDLYPVKILEKTALNQFRKWKLDLLTRRPWGLPESINIIEKWTGWLWATK